MGRRGVGWPDVLGEWQARPTHSWAVGRGGVPTAAAGSDVGKLQRHADITNDVNVWGLLFGKAREVSDAAQAELAYVLAGTGCQPTRQVATWHVKGRTARPLTLEQQPETPGCTPLRALQHCAWQQLDTICGMELAEGAGIDADHTQQARAAAAELRALGEAAEEKGGMVPDGVVPAPLRRFLIGIGVRAGEARTDTARVVATTCRAVQWAGLARARETAAQLDALGLHLPELLGGAGEATAPCVACGSEARRLFCVRPGTPEGKKIVGAANARVGEAANRRVGRKQGRQTLAAVKEMHATNGVLVCIACAAPRMAEVRALAARAPARTAAKEQLEAAQHEADAAQAARSARALERTAGKRVAEMEKPPEIDAATNANALWQTRCALAVAPQDTTAAFPGVRCYTAAQATAARRPPLRPGTGGDVLGCVFEHDGKHWCIEELGLADEDDSVGFYAYDTKRWASATLKLDERCKFFGEAMLRMVEQALAERQAQKRSRDFLSNLERQLMHSNDGGGLQAARQPPKPSPGRVAVGTW